MLVAAVAFASGALWQRHAIYERQLSASRQEAVTVGASIAQLFFLDGWPGYPYYFDEHHMDLYGPAKVATASWVIVTEDGTVVTANGDLAPYFSAGTVRIDPMEHLAGDDGTTRLDFTGLHGVGRLDGRVATLIVAERAVDAQVVQSLLVLRHPPPPRTGPTFGPPPVPRPPPGAQPQLVFGFVLISPFEAEAAVAAVDRTLAIGLPIAALLVGCLTWLVAGRVLRPVEAIRAELADITSGDLDRRVPVPRSGDEINQLAVTTNATLDRLQLAAEQQRRFVDDAAHELRSPLAGLRNELEVAVAHPDPAGWPASAVAALRSAKRLQALTDDLLMLTRTDRPAAPAGALVDLGALVSEQLAEREYLNPAGPRFTAKDPVTQVEVPGDEGQLGRLLRNLLDNAARHAEGAVTVSLRPAETSVSLEVADDGPGIAAGDRERVFGRFTRLDDDRSRDHGGAGLGLAIVADIAARHGGAVHVADSERGARFVVRLPTAAPAG
jgi:signal transduction histidine kinase